MCARTNNYYAGEGIMLRFMRAHRVKKRLATTILSLPSLSSVAMMSALFLQILVLFLATRVGKKRIGYTDSLPFVIVNYNRCSVPTWRHSSSWRFISMGRSSRDLFVRNMGHYHCMHKQLFRNCTTFEINIVIALMPLQLLHSVYWMVAY